MVAKIICMSPQDLKQDIYNKFVIDINENLVDPYHTYTIRLPKQCLEKYWVELNSHNGVTSLDYNNKPWEIYMNIFQEVLADFTKAGWKIEEDSGRFFFLFS